MSLSPVAFRPPGDWLKNRKIKKDLGWSPKNDLQSGLRRTVEWYLDHREWTETVLSENYGRERLGLGGMENVKRET